MEKFYSCEEVAERYGLQLSTIWTWVREKKLPAVKLGGVYRIKETDLLEFENASKTTESKEV